MLTMVAMDSGLALRAPRNNDGQQLVITRESVLHRILRKIEIADEADQRRQRPAGLVAKYFFDVCRGHAGAPLRSVIPGCARNDGVAVTYEVTTSRHL